ncbi:ATP-binding protein [Planococcus salinus]|uniref:ATP-binding protein n=1 Tax=Planococcus salinus TaxID=1848460 RepID=A0A3M8P6Z6_9BACL|nr:ATP-binding protein [Planococcus salinus]RNF39448.1 ATP-binding protein [Planococcus salinus]
MPSLKMLIGLPASGKTTYARRLVHTDSNWVHLSSDEIAYAKYPKDQPINHQEVFQELFLKTLTCLKDGKNVIYDATNLASQKRKSFINRIKELHVHVEAIIFITPYDLLKERNNARESWQRVPPYILDRYIRAFQFPRKDENFDECSIITDHTWNQPPETKQHSQIIRGRLMEGNLSFNEWMELYNLFEDTKPFLWLIKDSSSLMSAANLNTYQAYKKMVSAAPTPHDQEVMAWTILLHQIGKAYVRKNRPMEEDNFYGFEHASTYMAYPILSSLRIPEPLTWDILLLIDEHIIGRQMKRGKVKRRIGTANYERLVNFWGFLSE